MRVLPLSIREKQSLEGSQGKRIPQRPKKKKKLIFPQILGQNLLKKCDSFCPFLLGKNRVPKGRQGNASPSDLIFFEIRGLDGLKTIEEVCEHFVSFYLGKSEPVRAERGTVPPATFFKKTCFF